MLDHHNHPGFLKLGNPSDAAEEPLGIFVDEKPAKLPDGRHPAILDGAVDEVALVLPLASQLILEGRERGWIEKEVGEA